MFPPLLPVIRAEETTGDSSTLPGSRFINQYLLGICPKFEIKGFADEGARLPKVAKLLLES